MDQSDRSSLRLQARQCLENAAFSPTRLIAIHTGAVLLFSLLLTAANYFLEQQIGSTGGLGGMGSRAMLATAQSVLQLAQTVLLPFWQMGYIYAAMKLARQEPVEPGDLLEGFRRFGPVLRLQLLKTAIAIFIVVMATNIATTVFLLTPFSAPLLEVIEPMLTDPNAMNDPAALQEAIAAASGQVLVPLVIIVAVVLLVLAAPVFYHYRLASYFLLDSENPKAFAAMGSSRRLMRYLCIDFFKLDLSFWWFYALELLLGLVCCGDWILTALGIPLPFSADAAYFLCFGLYLAGQLGLYLWKKNQVEVTYACTYEYLRSNHDPKPQPKPDKQPWVY